MFKGIARILAAASFFIPAVLHAALSWDGMTFKKDALPSDTEAVADFSFRNTGDSSVHVSSIRSSCGCTTANLDKRDYAPGDSGSIHVVFEFGSRVGSQHKTVAVEYEQGGQTTTVVLELFVNIPDLVDVTPRVQYWSVTEDCAAKTVQVVVNNPNWTATHVKMYSQHSNFKVSKLTDEGSGKYSFRIEPLSTDEAQTEAGELLLESSGQEPKKILFYASVRP